MSLDFEYGDVKNWKTVCEVPVGDGSDDKQVSVITNRVIWGCYAIDLNGVTAKNYEKWFARYTLWQQTSGQKHDLTIEDVERHIGLGTNVLNTTRRQFDEKMSAYYKRQQRGGG